MTSLTLNKTSTTIPRWGQETLVATVTPTNASDTGVDWSSDHPEIASVDPDGTVHGVTAGTATIKALAHDGSGCFEECVVTVTYTAVTGVTLPATAFLALGESLTLSPVVSPAEATKKTVTWSGDNDSIATVNASTGEITPVAAGTVNITVTTDDGGHTATCSVTVYRKITSVSLNKSTINPLYRRCTETLTASISPADATGVTYSWHSDAPGVASVNSSGVVTGEGDGTANITVTATDIAGNSVTSSACTVTVTGTVTFVTNRSLYNYADNATDTKYGANNNISLKFNEAFYARPSTGTSGYITLDNRNKSASFTVTGYDGAKITQIQIYYENNYNPASVSVTAGDGIYTAGTNMGTWTNSSGSSPVTLSLTGPNTTYRTHITSIVISYE